MLLKRDISVLTQRFKTAWDKYTKQRAESRKKPIGDDVTPEQFHVALTEFGIDNAGKLAEVVGLKQTQAEKIWRHPQELTAERQRKLMQMVDGECGKREALWREMRDLADRTGDEVYEADAIRASDDWGRASDAALLLDGDCLRVQADDAARGEFQCRALIEGFNALTDADRCFILRTIDGMLSRYPGDEARNIRDVLGKTHFGRFARLRDLAKLVASREVLDQYDGWGSAIMEREILGEYVDGQK